MDFARDSLYQGTALEVLVPYSPADLDCRRCGTTPVENAIFCHHCGAGLSDYSKTFNMSHWTSSLDDYLSVKLSLPIVEDDVPEYGIRDFGKAVGDNNEEYRRILILIPEYSFEPISGVITVGAPQVVTYTSISGELVPQIDLLPTLKEYLASQGARVVWEHPSTAVFEL